MTSRGEYLTMHRRGGGRRRLARVLATLAAAAILLGPNATWSDDIDCGPQHRALLDSVKFVAGQQREFTWVPPKTGEPVSFVLQYGDTLIGDLHMDDTLVLRRIDGQTCVVFDGIEREWDDARAPNVLRNEIYSIDAFFESMMQENDDGYDEKGNFIVVTNDWSDDRLGNLGHSLLMLHLILLEAVSIDLGVSEVYDNSNSICAVYIRIREIISKGNPNLTDSGALFLDHRCFNGQ